MGKKLSTASDIKCRQSKRVQTFYECTTCALYSVQPKKQAKTETKTVTSCIYLTKVEGKALPLDINKIKIIASGMVIYLHT